MKIKICIFIMIIQYYHANQQPYNNPYNSNHQPQYNYYPQQPSHQSKHLQQQQQQQQQQQTQYSYVNPNQLINDSINANNNINSSPYYHHNLDPYHIDHDYGDDDDLNDISSNRSKSSNSYSYENNNSMKFNNNQEYYQSVHDTNNKNFMTASSITDDDDISSSISMNKVPITTTTNIDINDKYKSYYDLPTYSSVPTYSNDVSSSIPTTTNNGIDEYGDYRNNNNNNHQYPNTNTNNSKKNYNDDHQQHQQQQQQRQQNENENNNYLQNEELSQLDKDFIFEGLKQLYKKKVLPIEINSKFSHFSSPPMSPSDFDAKPMVLIIGQYSVGKTSFIRSLLKQDFPGQRIGPEPTTDRFTAIMYPSSEEAKSSSSSSSLFSSPSSFFQSSYSTQQSLSSSSSSSFIPPMGKLLPGHALVMQANKPFRGLASFGNNFLSKFEGAEVYSSILQNITIIDTPGIE